MSVVGRVRREAFVLCLVLSATPAVAQSEAGQQAARLVESMAESLKTLNYEGTFVHIQGSSVAAMRILHSSDARGELERMVSLDGEAREVIRNNRKVTCIWPASESVVVSKSKPRELLPSVDVELTRNPAYVLRLGDIDRVAGRESRIVDIRPRDDFRYGYRFWIDRETRMLLRYLLLDGPRKVIEQIMFTTIRYPETIDPARFEVDVSDDQVTWVDVQGPEGGVDLSGAFDADGDLKTPASDAQAPAAADRVEFDDLPMGYVEVSETYRSMPIDTGPISHVMLSDGMASVSVYVEHVPADQQHRGTEGFSAMGAVNAYGRSLDSAYVTAVGEVPAATVRRIAEAVQVRAP